MVRPSLPSVRVVSGADAEQPLRSRLRGARRALRPVGAALAEVVAGFWPLIALGLFAFGLSWAFALSASP
jgi:hypothetical protein